MLSLQWHLKEKVLTLKHQKHHALSVGLYRISRTGPQSSCLCILILKLDYIDNPIITLFLLITLQHMNRSSSTYCSMVFLLLNCAYVFAYGLHFTCCYKMFPLCFHPVFFFHYKASFCCSTLLFSFSHGLGISSLVSLKD